MVRLSRAILWLVNNGWTIVCSFKLRSFKYVFTILADSWSVKGVTTRVVFSVVDLDRDEDWSATLTFRKVLTGESRRCLGYFSLENIDFSHSPSSVKLDHDVNRRYAQTYYRYGCGIHSSTTKRNQMRLPCSQIP